MYDRVVDNSLAPQSHPDRGDRWAQDRVNSHIDQVQIALAIADESLLKSLLTDCSCPIVPLHQIGHISSMIGIRLASGETVDAILNFERIICVPAESEETDDTFSPCFGKSSFECERELSKLTRCESELQTLTHHASLTETITLLTHVGFSPDQIRTILHLAQEAWHKTWWYTLDQTGEFSIPFHRRMRTRCYADGTFTIQYKDYFPDEKPPCFSSQNQRVIIAIHQSDRTFSEMLSSINYSRDQLNIDQAILICDRLSELEARGFLSQGISLYAASELSVSSRADCMICVNEECPMNKRANSPVITCHQFCVGDWQE